MPGQIDFGFFVEKLVVVYIFFLFEYFSLSLSVHIPSSFFEVHHLTKLSVAKCVILSGMDKLITT
jgi:hypothetical protein